MPVRIVENKGDWESLCAKFGANFLQSWAWGEVLKADGKQVERLALEKGLAQVVYSDLPLGMRYAFCPKGPVGEGFRIEDSGLSVDLSNYLKEKKCIFWRIEPKMKILDSKSSILNPQSCILRTIDITPRATLILDLKKSEEELLAGMHQKTRYNINLAGKKNLKISAEKNAEIFISLEKATAKRDGFKTHNEKHYQNVLASDFVFQLTAYTPSTVLPPVSSTGQALKGGGTDSPPPLLGEGQGVGLKPIASAVFVGFGDTFTYLYGASDYEHRNLMAPYLLQWEGITLGKKLGYAKYDFFGIAPQNEPHHQYAGVTRFKLGFGGAVVEDPGTFDLILDQKKYKLYTWLRKLRRLL